MQIYPLPKWPSVQTHSNIPGLLVQLAFTEQLSCLFAHSSISKCAVKITSSVGHAYTLIRTKYNITPVIILCAKYEAQKR